jgi:hypothetical protein
LGAKLFSADHRKNSYPTHQKKNLGVSHDIIPALVPVLSPSHRSARVNFLESIFVAVAWQTLLISVPFSTRKNFAKLRPYFRGWEGAKGAAAPASDPKRTRSEWNRATLSSLAVTASPENSQGKKNPQHGLALGATWKCHPARSKCVMLGRDFI